MKSAVLKELFLIYGRGEWIAKGDSGKTTINMQVCSTHSEKQSGLGSPGSSESEPRLHLLPDKDVGLDGLRLAF